MNNVNPAYNNPAFNPASNPAFPTGTYQQQEAAQGAPQAASQPTSQTPAGQAPYMQPPQGAAQVPPYPRVQQPPMYTAPMRPRVQVHFKDTYITNKSPNIFVAFLAVVGIVVTAVSALQIFVYPDRLMPLLNFDANISAIAGIGFFLAAGVSLIIAGISAVFKKSDAHSQAQSAYNQVPASASARQEEKKENDSTAQFSATDKTTEFPRSRDEEDTVTLDEFKVE
ncbi:hypothetical protein [Alloscardovia omnicolens]|uniref:hypothetical protein n=1 Tax=Alloscardovia omnicolens TaxID=419015 RepID=UPI003A78EFFB